MTPTADGARTISPFSSIARPDDDAHVIQALANRHGYLFCPRLVPHPVIRALGDAALSCAGRLGWLKPGSPRRAASAPRGVALGAYDDPRWIAFLKVMLPHPAFKALRREPRILDMLEHILGAPPVSDAGDLLRVVSSDDHTHTTVAHQDRFYLDGRSPRWTVWIPLVDCPLSLGPISIWRGSHRRGLRPHHGPRDWQHGVRVPSRAAWEGQDLEVGDAVLFSWLTVHRAEPNRTAGRLRLSAVCRYRAAP